MTATTADDLGKLLLRLTLGVLILFHGAGKLTGGLDPIRGMLEGVGLPAALAYGAWLGEVLGPILLILGWYARVGAGLIAVNMLFALGLAHRQELWQLNEHGGWQLELQGMFLFTAIALVLTGPGRLAVNQR
jgi:putative oxidoreductase